MPDPMFASRPVSRIKLIAVPGLFFTLAPEASGKRRVFLYHLKNFLLEITICPVYISLFCE